MTVEKEIQRSILALTRRREEYVRKIVSHSLYERGVAYGLDVALTELAKLEERVDGLHPDRASRAQASEGGT